MGTMILSSTGFTNKNIRDKFLGLINMPANKLKTIFIPTAAISEDAKQMVSVCWNQLIEAGIIEDNIYTYNLDRKISAEELCKFDIIYVCGGNAQYLLNKMNQCEFGVSLKKFLNQGGIYVGVSAGSVVLSKNIVGNLGYINCILNVHAKQGHSCGIIDISDCPTVNLTNSQAIVITDKDVSVMG